jgi:hypothetical protein
METLLVTFWVLVGIGKVTEGGSRIRSSQLHGLLVSTISCYFLLELHREDKPGDRRVARFGGYCTVSVTLVVLSIEPADPDIEIV